MNKLEYQKIWVIRQEDAENQNRIGNIHKTISTKPCNFPEHVTDYRVESDIAWLMEGPKWCHIVVNASA